MHRGCPVAYHGCDTAPLLSALESLVRRPRSTRIDSGRQRWCIRSRVRAMRAFALYLVLKACALFVGLPQCDALQVTRLVAVGQGDAHGDAQATTTHTRSDAPTHESTSGTSSSTGTTTTTVLTGCGGVVRCLNHTHCAQCLKAINTTSMIPHTEAAYLGTVLATTRVYDIGFFRMLQTTPSCSTNATPPGVLHPALQELNLELCDAYGLIVGSCIAPEYACFVDPQCRQCLDALFAAADDSGTNGTKMDAFRSPACTTTSNALLNNLVKICGLGKGFPACTLFKHRCASMPECGACLATLGTKGGAAAARQCRGMTQPSSLGMNDVVSVCIESSAGACDFWRQRCADIDNCGACLAAMGNGDSFHEMVADWSTPACQRAATDFYARNYLNSITRACPAMSMCRRSITDCVARNGIDAIECLDGSAPPSYANFCWQLSQEYTLDTVCQPCSASVHTINSVVFATAAVGGTSAAACVAVATTIVAHGYDRVSMRDRTVVGLMLANAVYSTANAIPLNAVRTGVIDCGRLAMSFDAIRFGRAWWVCGKYGLVSFELLILGASIRALCRGDTAVPARAEAAMYAACCTLAALAFAVFYALCARINANGYNTSVEYEAYSNAHNHASINDDLDDNAPSLIAYNTFQRARDEYDNLVRNVLLAWDAVVGVAVAMWVLLRVIHQHALRALRTEAVAAAQAEVKDVWADTRRSAWEARRMILEARYDAFNEVAKPLEPYIFVFVVFAVPAFVMSTTFCQHYSGARLAAATTSDEGGGSLDFQYGTCDVWCEFVLAFRSMGTVAVYLIPRKRRAELVDVRSTWRKLCTRVLGCVLCTQVSYARLNPEESGRYELDELVEQPTVENPNDYGGVAAVALTELSSWHIDESSIAKVRQLGEGAFGGVWEGRLLPVNVPVAIKILFAGAVDEDGDVVDLNADEDFRKECAALQRVDSTYLIKFFGFGTTTEGNGFIVTELLGGGSLEGALHDSEYDIPWHLSITFGMHVALGMEHLHHLHMLHRDLKSANVLLNEQHTQAKVCDFGLTRVARPARRHVMHSPFTGMRRLLPSVDGIDDMAGGQSLLLMDRAALCVEDARGTMTKAAGTLRWMAPEVFRGDQNYTKAVDVYSFGIVLWELTTRKVPWVGELSSDELELFEGLNRALQSGRRPKIPDAVRAEHGAFVALMERCWAGDPANRPTFSEAARDLAAIVDSQYMYM